ncbi:MAG: hypothetical protein H0W83_16295, partial [Planctomycetes bacterium]|nr:hypothetical protein [Planctomycetota bacterium]
MKPGSPDRGADDLGALSRSRELFSFLDRQRIAWCVVGDCSDLERTIRSDIDIVVDGAALPGIAA